MDLRKRLMGDMSIDDEKWSKKDLEERCNDNLTAIQAAIVHGRSEEVEYLISLGSNVNVLDDFGNGLLHLLFLYSSYVDGRDELVSLLIKKGLNVNMKNDNGETICHLMTSGDVDFILKIGCDVNIQDNLGRNGLHVATEEGIEEDELELIVKHIKDINCQDRDGLTAIHYLACRGYGGEEEEIIMLMKYGAKIDIEDNKGNIPTFDTEDVDMIEFLVTQGANINHQNKYGDSILHYWAEMGDKENYEFLVSLGANDALKNRHGITPKDKFKNAIMNH